MTRTLRDFARRRIHAAETLESLAAAVDPSDPSAAERLARLGARAREGRFVIQLIGCFSSGKSTLLNALLGEPVLPVKVNPCTAIPTELVWSAAPSVDVHTHDGAVRRLSVDEFLREFQLRTADLTRAGAEAEDRFGDVDKARVRWPLPILRDGAVLVDTPGLDDDPARTARTLASLPDADAVIFVLSATRFLTDLERRTLRHELLPLGLHNLFFPTTMVDLLAALSDQPDEDLAHMRAQAYDVLRPLCQVDGEDRFGERFSFLNARGALQARYDGEARRDPPDTAALNASGLPPFEAAMERFLVEERGRAQLSHLALATRSVHEDLQRRAEVDQATASASVDELRQRQEELAPRFADLEAIARAVGRRVDTFIARQQVRVWQDLRDFMARTEEELPDAVAGFDLGGLAGLDLITPRGRARVEAALREQLEDWLSARVVAWRRTLGTRVEGWLDELRRDLSAEARDFQAVTEDIVVAFAGTHLGLPGRLSPDDEVEVDPTERWLAMAMGVAFLSPGAMAAGWSEGYQGALKGAASRVGIQLALLAVGALLGPVGWAGLVLYVVSDAVLLVLTGGAQLRRLREQVAEQLRGKLVAQADAVRDDIAARVAEGLEPLRDALVGAAEADAAELRGLLEQTIAARQEAARDAEARAARWQDTLAALRDGQETLDALARLEEIHG